MKQTTYKFDKFDNIFEQEIFNTDAERDELLKKRLVLSNIFWVSFLGTCALRKNYKDNQKVKMYFMNEQKMKLKNIDENSNDIMYSIKLLVDAGHISSTHASKLTMIMAKLKTGIDIEEGVLFKSIKEFMSGKIISKLLPSGVIMTLIRDFKKNKITLNDMILPFYNFAKKKDIAKEFQRLAKPIINSINTSTNTTIVSASTAASATASNMIKTAPISSDKNKLSKVAKNKINAVEIEYEKFENAIMNNEAPPLNGALFHLLETVYKNKNLDQFDNEQINTYASSLKDDTDEPLKNVINKFDKVYPGVLELDSNDNIMYKIMIDYDKVLTLSTTSFNIYKIFSDYMNKNQKTAAKYINSKINYRIFEKYIENRQSDDFTNYEIRDFVIKNYKKGNNDQVITFFREWSENGEFYKKMSNFKPIINNVLIETITTHIRRASDTILDKVTIFGEFKEYVLAQISLLTNKDKDILIEKGLLDRVTNKDKDIESFIIEEYNLKSTDLSRTINFIKKSNPDTIKTKKDAINALIPILLQLQKTNQNIFEYYFTYVIFPEYKKYYNKLYDDFALLFENYDYSIIPNLYELKKIFGADIFAYIGKNIFKNYGNIEKEFISACLLANTRLAVLNLDSTLLNGRRNPKFLKLYSDAIIDIFNVIIKEPNIIKYPKEIIKIFAIGTITKKSINYNKKYFDLIINIIDPINGHIYYISKQEKNSEIISHVLKDLITKYGKNKNALNETVNLLINDIYIDNWNTENIRLLDDNIFSKLISIKSTILYNFVNSRYYTVSNRKKLPETVKVINKFFEPYNNYDNSIEDIANEIINKNKYDNSMGDALDDILNSGYTAWLFIKGNIDATNYRYYKTVPIIEKRLEFELNNLFDNPSEFNLLKSNTSVEGNVLFRKAIDKYLSTYIIDAKPGAKKIKNILSIIQNKNNNSKKKSYTTDLKIIESLNEKVFNDINKDNIDEITQDLDEPFAKKIFSNCIQKNIVNKQLINDIMNPNINKGIIPDIEQNVNKIKEILKFNDFKVPSIKITKKKNETFSEVYEKIKSSIDNEFESIPKISVDQVQRTEEEFNKMSYDFHKKYHAGKHGDIAIKILKEYNVSLPTNEWELFKKFEKGDGTIYPAFHGTGTIAASMILRFGFKIVDIQTLTKAGVGAVGRMLDDGIYFGITFDKVAGYVGDGAWSQNYGTKGYIFEMEATLGKKGTNYNAAGIGGDKIRSPEYCVFSPGEQLKIVKCYYVELTSIERINRLKNLNESKNFNDILLEAPIKNKKQRGSIRYIFYDGDVCLPNGNVKFVKNIKILDKRNVTISPNSKGTEIELFNNLGINKIIRIPNVFTFMRQDPEGLFSQYKELIKGKIS